MSNTDWYARKLGQPPARRDPTPPQPVQHRYPPQQQQGQAYTQPQEQYEQPGWEQMDKDQRFNALLHTVPAPGAGNRDAQTCPECGSGNFFSRRNSSGLRSTEMYAAPQCFDCGYPLVQTGSIGGELGGG